MYQLNNSNGEVEGWFSPLNSAGNDLESKVPGVELLKVSASAQVLEELEPLQIKQALIENAREMACDSIIMPKSITVGMSAGVSVEFVTGANGAMSIQMSWDTADLCRDLM
ncbi:hypothetical protein ACN3E9_11255 [Vibrio pectenicida]|uniref:hypothetical protein n=1 Tax=Vibrio pectenicida TaxID=62763 RepID=UPI003B9A009C